MKGEFSLSLSLSLQTALFFSLSREMLNASAVVPRAFACSKYARARVTREEALLEEKRKDGRERLKNFYLVRTGTFYEFCENKVSSKKEWGSSKTFFDLKCQSRNRWDNTSRIFPFLLDWD